MKLLAMIVLILNSLSFATDSFTGFGPLDVKKVLSFKPSSSDTNTEAVFRVKTSDGFLKTLSCVLPQGAKEPIKRVKILEKDANQVTKNVYFCIGSAE